MLNVEVTNYTAVNEGYDGVFGYYVDYIKEMVPDALNQFMAIATLKNPNGGDGQKYFDCKYEGRGKTISQACPISVSCATSKASFHVLILLMLVERDCISFICHNNIHPDRRRGFLQSIGSKV